MKIIAIIYLLLFVFDKLATPLLFGQARKPYSYGNWVVSVIISLPLWWLLWQVIFA